MNLQRTFLWHDYETFGANTRQARPAQFAAIRTDSELREINEPIVLYCQPANDFLPDPQSCLITGITPQLCLTKGLPEYQFAAQIEQVLSQPSTIGVGYNTLRFDDEITRFMFWRSLIDPYAREWQNQCSRWDILDLVRTCYALRPDGIAWPRHEDSSVSFRLEDLAKANGLVHDAAHDALSDVRATIALARLIRQTQPRLFDFCLELRSKERVKEELGLFTLKEQAKPFVHISGMFSPERGCAAIMWPLAPHPTNKNELLAWDLTEDPSVLNDLNAAQIRERLFTKTQDLPAGLTRLPIKGVHFNKSPVVISNPKIVDEIITRWNMDSAAIERHRKAALALPDMQPIWAAVYRREIEAVDIDEDLYGGFVSNNDRRTLNQLRSLSPEALSNAHPVFEDDRLDELLFRYRARNHPDFLSNSEKERWQAHRTHFLKPQLNPFFEELTRLVQEQPQNATVLNALRAYAQTFNLDLTNEKHLN